MSQDFAEKFTEATKRLIEHNKKPKESGTDGPGWSTPLPDTIADLKTYVIVNAENFKAGSLTKYSYGSYEDFGFQAKSEVTEQTIKELNKRVNAAFGAELVEMKGFVTALNNWIENDSKFPEIHYKANFKPGLVIQNDSTTRSADDINQRSGGGG